MEGFSETMGRMPKPTMLLSETARRMPKPTILLFETAGRMPKPTMLLSETARRMPKPTMLLFVTARRMPKPTMKKSVVPGETKEGMSYDMPSKLVVRLFYFNSLILMLRNLTGEPWPRNPMCPVLLKSPGCS